MYTSNIAIAGADVCLISKHEETNRAVLLRGPTSKKGKKPNKAEHC